MKLKTIILIAVLLPAALAASAPFSFVRPAKVSDSFRCSILIRQSSQYSFFIPGADQPVVKLSSVQAEFYGYLTVRKVNSAGNPERLLIRSDRMSGSINGLQLKSALPSGSLIEADLSGGKSVFSVGGKMPDPDLQIILSHLFPPASDSSLADLTGRSRILPKQGEGWKPDLTSFLKMLAQRRIQLTPSAFRSGITYQGTERIGKLPCRKFSILIETSRPTDYDCRFKLSFSMATSGPPVRSDREVTEVIRQVIRSDQPFASGTRIELLNQDHSEYFLFPVKSIPPQKKAPEKLGTWESLLH